MIDDRLSFGHHVRNIGIKASSVQVALARMMPNVRGPRSNTRVLNSRVVSSIILYASQIWADVLLVKSRRSELNSVCRRSALRIISGYRTVSDEAAFVLAGMTPIDI